jgi:hypothetical protein
MTILKSVVLDLGQGRIGAVSYNSATPLSAPRGRHSPPIEAGHQRNRRPWREFSKLQGARVVLTAR